jgi:hypothetical protein
MEKRWLVVNIQEGMRREESGRDYERTRKVILMLKLVCFFIALSISWL